MTNSEYEKHRIMFTTGWTYWGARYHEENSHHQMSTWLTRPGEDELPGPSHPVPISAGLSDTLLWIVTTSAVATASAYEMRLMILY